MRTARPVGLTDDGGFLIVETADGDSISVQADEVRTALRNRPRRHLETEMEQSMTPREIQMKIRAGASVEEIAEASGMPTARVEAFAAPVLAERNHIAGLAQLGSVRRAGEPAGHRTLRAAVSDRLKERGVDPDTVEWDSFKMDDGRWSVSAAYRVEQADRVAVFYFDQRGRFSVSGNDEGRWAIGEQLASAAGGSQTHVDDVDTEPTLKLAGPADELALLRAVETDETTPDTDPEPEAESAAPTEAETRAADEPDEVEAQVEPEPQVEPEAEPEAEAPDEQQIRADATAVPDESSPEAAVPEEPSQLDLLYELLGSDGYAEDSIRVFEGLSDATAVPDVADGAWQESRSEEDHPAETGADQSATPFDAEAEPEAEVEPEVEAERESEAEPETEVEPEAEPETEAEPAAEAEAEQPVTGAPTQSEVQPEIFADGAAQDALPEAESESESENHAGAETTSAGPTPEAKPKPAAKPKKRKRASVPSWDEIMFGSPGPKGK